MNTVHTIIIEHSLKYPSLDDAFLYMNDVFIGMFDAKNVHKMIETDILKRTNIVNERVFTHNRMEISEQVQHYSFIVESNTLNIKGLRENYKDILKDIYFRTRAFLDSVDYKYKYIDTEKIERLVARGFFYHENSYGLYRTRLIPFTPSGWDYVDNLYSSAWEDEKQRIKEAEYAEQLKTISIVEYAKYLFKNRENWGQILTDYGTHLTYYTDGYRTYANQKYYTYKNFVIRSKYFEYNLLTDKIHTLSNKKPIADFAALNEEIEQLQLAINWAKRHIKLPDYL